MTKILIAFPTGADLATVSTPSFRSALAAAGATRVQANLPDAAFVKAMSLQEAEVAIGAAVAVWAPDQDAHQLLDAVRTALGSVGAGSLMAWSVDATEPLVAEHPGDGERFAALANLAFLRRPEAMPYDEWRAYWQGTHTQVAIDTQATFGYVQNRVLEALTETTPAVAAIVEELFPEAAAHDIHVFYGTGGDKAVLKRNLDQMMASIAKFGAGKNLDLVPTARYLWHLT